MKNIFTLTLLALATFCAAQSNQVKTPGVSYSAGAPNWVPVVKTASELAIDTTSKRMYLWNRNTGAWDLQGRGVDQTSGATPPAYTPGQTDSYLAVNNANPPELYAWSGSAWVKVGGVAYTAGTGITLTGPNSTVINNAGDLSATNELNTAFDISGGNLRIIDAGATRTVAITSIAPDQSVTNELQTIDTFLVSGSNLLLSLSQDNQPAKTITLPASGITALTGDVTASGPGSAVATIATASASVRGLLSSADWSTFNGKLGGSGTSGQVGYFTGGSTLSGGSNLLFNNSTITLSLVNSTFNSAGRGLEITQTTADGASAYTTFRKSRGGLITSGTGIGTIDFQGFDGAAYQISSRISAAASGTPSTGIVPGNISFFTANTSGTLTSRMSIDEAGNVGIGGTPTERLKIVSGNIEIDAARRYRWSDGSFLEGGGTSSLMTIRSLGNFLMQGSNLYLATTAGTPSAKLHVVGAGATSSTWTAQFHNFSGSNNALMVRDDGRVGFGTSTLDENFNFSFAQNGSTNIRIVNANTGSSARTAFLSGATGASAGFFACPSTYTAVPEFTSRGVFSTDGALSNGLLLRASTGNIEFMTSLTVRAMLTNGGSLLIGTTTDAASAALNVTSTTKGFLPPRMTADQASAIASPAEGLMLYVTNTNGTFTSKGWWGYNGAGWEKLNN